MSEMTWNRRLTFKRPTISKRHYISVGSSGWTESFEQTVCDQALAGFAGSVPVDELADNFLSSIKLRINKEVGWNDITKYLGRIFDIESENVPVNVAIGFWAYLVKKEQ